MVDEAFSVIKTASGNSEETPVEPTPVEPTDPETPTETQGE
jgi:hypothetical protein